MVRDRGQMLIQVREQLAQLPFLALPVTGKYPERWHLMQGGKGALVRAAPRQALQGQASWAGVIQPT